MPTGKEFLDLPSEFRNHIYELVIRSGHFLARTKRPGALIDRWNNASYPSFYNSNIFQSSSALIAADRQICTEFYSTLHSLALDESQYIEVYVSDLDFQPLMDLINSLSTERFNRFQAGGSCRILAKLDFEHFPALKKTSLEDWLNFIATHKITVSHYDIIKVHPLQKEWIGHGFEYGNWVRDFFKFVADSIKSLKVAADGTPPFEEEDPGDYRHRLIIFKNSLQSFLREVEYMEDDWWRSGGLQVSRRNFMFGLEKQFE